jgi:hypothetical protein
MSIGITGIGIVTPLGHEIRTVAERISRGERAFRVENFDVSQFASSDRLRRCPAITHFAVGATALALKSAGISANGENPRIGVIAAIAKGTLIYSRKFHAQFVQGGAKMVSPMLFPETVANAPASHVASVFGLTGPNATLLGDAAVAFNALAMARDFLEWNLADAMLVVAPHEHDRILEDAYARFRWLFKKIPFSEGAAAMMLTRERGNFGEILHVDRGFPWHNRAEIPKLLEKAAQNLPEKPRFVSVSDDEKLIFGEAFAAGALWQVLFALEKLSRGECALVKCAGLNEQVSAVLVKR